jgi:hypothetical protein
MKGRKNANKEMKKYENVIQNKIQDFKIVWKTKFRYKPTYKVRSVWEECLAPPLAWIIDSALQFQQYFPSLLKGLAMKST